MPQAQERYFDQLMERVREDRYPSLDLLDRIESSLWNPDQLNEYVDSLLGKLDESWYPSKEILNRIQRLMLLAA